MTDPLASARPVSLWHDLHDHQKTTEELHGPQSADLTVIGGGFTGLWTAITAKRRHPDWSVVLLEAGVIGFGASGRNGGFISESITHGLAHGLALWPDRIDELLQIGRDNLTGLAADLEAAGIDAQLHLTGKTVVATRPHEVDALAEVAALMTAHGEDAEFLDASQVRADIDSPTYLAGVRVRTGGGILDPMALTIGLRDWATRLGVEIHEGSRVTAVDGSTAGGRAGGSAAGGSVVHTAEGQVRSRRVAVATNAYRNVVRRLRKYIVPVYDHVLATEPLTDEQWASLGWSERQGVTDAGNQFHYYRPTPDGRILWGGYDAIYYYGSSWSAAREQRDASHRLLADQFFETFPQLAGTRFTHRWAGLIDTSTRFVPYIGIDRTGAVAHAVGFTGLGVAYSRLAAALMIDALDGIPVPFYAGHKPMPFPPEPARYLAIQTTRAALAREDRVGRRGLLLRTLDRFGVGFNS